ncbi:hypothetical protein [Idiomarina sp.]|uniref:hypothetical protein n=1 Tax=Idiomarina sp. TaxID=1874361 RepID=UPI0017B013B8|nr:hypothetical protein [Alteromonadaceae bacterium]
MTTTLDIVDTAVKIGLGALIAGITSYVITLRNQGFERQKEIEVERRNLSKELALTIEKTNHLIDESAFHFHQLDYQESKKCIISAEREISSAGALANLLGSDDLVNAVDEMAELVFDIYKEFNKDSPDEGRLHDLDNDIKEKKKLVYPHIRDAYCAAST